MNWRKLTTLSVLGILTLAGKAQELSPYQKSTVDSLKKVIETANHDSVIVKAMIEWDNIIYNSDPELDLKLNLSIDSISAVNLDRNISSKEKELFLYFRGFATGNLGLIYNSQGDNTKALEYLFEAVEIRKMLKNKKGVAYAYNNIGAIYNEQGIHNKAIEYYTKSLVIHEEIGNHRGMGGALNNIAIIHKSLGNYESALNFYEESLQLKKDNQDTAAIAVGYLNIGALYLELEKFDPAKNYFFESLKLSEAKDDSINISRAFVNLGSVYQQQKILDSALYYYKKGYNIQLGLNDKKVITETTAYLGSIYYDLNQLSTAEDFALKALNLSTENEVIKVSEQTSGLLYRIYKKMNQSKASLEMLELNIKLKDSINSEKNQKEVIRQQYKYEYEKQAATDSIQAAEEAKLKDAKLSAQLAKTETQEQQKYFLFGILALTFVFGIFILNRLRITRKQKEIIEDQKEQVDHAFEILEDKNREVLDSINYAQRIQRSFLATESSLNNHLKDHFVYFNPKEAVSGDFYWAEELNNGNFAICCADSTGHGVPGAIMSILNISSIEKAVEKGHNVPADIFNETRKLIIERLKKDGSSEGGKDGMDASLIALNSEKTKMQYVAAHNPIWIIRNGELIDIKAEKMPVGKHDHDHIPFKGGEIELQKGDIIYTTTDGFQDQFGGKKGKKFKVKPMKRLLLEIADLPMSEQLQKITTTFDQWKGDLEQVDDVCIIGIRV